MEISQDQFRQMLRTAAESLLAHEDELSDIDSRFGDGDHGVTMGKIARLILEETDRWADESIADFLDTLGMDVMEVKGGSAGPLYGTLIGGLGAELSGADALGEAEARAMFAGCLAEMEDITDAAVGDKTMMDALIPAAEAAQTASGARGVFLAAAAAAEAGAERSRDFPSKYGRAKSYKEATVGTPDAGAVSVSLFLRGLADGLPDESL